MTPTNLALCLAPTLVLGDKLTMTKDPTSLLKLTQKVNKAMEKIITNAKSILDAKAKKLKR